MSSTNKLVTAITAAAIALSEGRTTDDITLLGAILTQLGDTLNTIAAHQGFIEQCEQACEQRNKPKKN